MAISPAVSPEKASKVNCSNALPLMTEVVTQVSFHCCPLCSVFFVFFPARSKWICGFLACFMRAGPVADKMHCCFVCGGTCTLGFLRSFCSSDVARMKK